MTELIGLIAAALTTLSFLPQAVRVVRTRRVEELSVAMYILLVFGKLSWLVYGYYIGSVAIVAANAITVVLAATILTTKLLCIRPRKQGKNVLTTQVAA